MSKASSTSSKPNGHWPSRMPDPEVKAQATRRRFSVAYKRRIVEEADRCTEPGAIGALLRREGLYSSQLATWRRQRTEGTLVEKPRGPLPNRWRQRMRVCAAKTSGCAGNWRKRS